MEEMKQTSKFVCTMQRLILLTLIHETNTDAIIQSCFLQFFTIRGFTGANWKQQNVAFHLKQKF